MLKTLDQLETVLAKISYYRLRLNQETCQREKAYLQSKLDELEKKRLQLMDSKDSESGQ